MGEAKSTRKLERKDKKTPTNAELTNRAKEGEGDFDSETVESSLAKGKK